MNSPPPFIDVLVIENNVGFRQECHKAVGNSQFTGNFVGILCAAGTPAIQGRTLLM